MIFPVYTDKGGYRRFGTKRSGKLFEGDTYHLGYDFNVPKGTKVRSIMKGHVLFAGQMNGFGSLFPSTKGGCVIIRHEFNDETYYGIYGHLDDIQVRLGEYVLETDVLGKVNSFTSNGVVLTHCHFGLFKCDKMPTNHLGYCKEIGNAIDPIKFIKDNEGMWLK